MPKDDKNKYKVLDARNAFPSQKNEFRSFLKSMKEIFPELIELGKLKSEYSKKRFDSLVEEGFSEKQALEIVKIEKTPFDTGG